jgi:hypothetical protein
LVISNSSREIDLEVFLIEENLSIKYYNEKIIKI